MASKPQKLVVHVHEGRKLFHVSMNNYDREYTEIYWKSNGAKARYAYSNLLAGNRNSGEQSLTAGFMIALVNTNYEGWYSHVEDGLHAKMDGAIEAKDKLIAAWQALGYCNVGMRNSTSKSNPDNMGLGSAWGKKWNISKMAKPKIDQHIEKVVSFINRSLNIEVPRLVKSRAFSAVATTGEVDNMATMLMFIRGKMGLDS